MTPAMPSMPRATEAARAAFQALLPNDPRVSIRPMFGNVAAFANGNMFAGLFGDDLFVRLPLEQRTRVLGEGGAEFEPMRGRPMKDYVTLPRSWRQEGKIARNWILRSLAWVVTLPPKSPKAGKK
jgi:TfoX/Sxy family transcriptional regulator of competence genes